MKPDVAEYKIQIYHFEFSFKFGWNGLFLSTSGLLVKIINWKRQDRMKFRGKLCSGGAVLVTDLKSKGEFPVFYLNKKRSILFFFFSFLFWSTIGFRLQLSPFETIDDSLDYEMHAPFLQRFSTLKMLVIKGYFYFPQLLHTGCLNFCCTCSIDIQ